MSSEGTVSFSWSDYFETETPDFANNTCTESYVPTCEWKLKDESDPTTLVNVESTVTGVSVDTNQLFSIDTSTFEPKNTMQLLVLNCGDANTDNENCHLYKETGGCA